MGVAFAAAHKMVSTLTSQVSDGTQYGTKTYTQGLVQRCLSAQAREWYERHWLLFPPAPDF